MTQPDNKRQSHSAPISVLRDDIAERRSSGNAGAALMFILIGGGALFMALGYPMGSMRRMGAGAYPLIISALMTGIGVVMLVNEFMAGHLWFQQHKKSRLTFRWSSLRAITIIMLSLLCFAFLIRPLGLVPATALLVFIATLAEPKRQLFGSFVLALASAGVAAFIFVYAVGLPIPLWW